MRNRNISGIRPFIESRRDFLKAAGTCGGMANAAFLSTYMSMRMTSSLMAQQTDPTDYKALVCVFFQAAQDSFNVLTPHGTTGNDTEYAAYRATRGRSGTAAAGIGLLRDTSNPTFASDGTLEKYTYQQVQYEKNGPLLPILDTQSGYTYGLHPALKNLRTIYDNGKATFVCNVGPLIHPIAKQSELAAATKPTQLYSHPDQQRHWQTAKPESTSEAKGWAGKALDVLFANKSAADQVFAAISTSGQSTILTGNDIVPYSIGSSGAVAVESYRLNASGTGYQYTNFYDTLFRTAMDADFLSTQYSNVLERTILDQRVGAKSAAADFGDAFTKALAMPTPLPGGFGTTGVSSSLQAVAQTIRAAQQASSPASLKQKRQIFVVTVGGWDHHSSVLNEQSWRLDQVDKALGSFMTFLEAEGLDDKVTLFTISDFARTLVPNSGSGVIANIGTDHAWGQNAIVMGGAVRSAGSGTLASPSTTPSPTRRIYGTYPSFRNQIKLDASGRYDGNSISDGTSGRLIPQTPTDRYFEELLTWFGLGPIGLSTILPRLGTTFSGSPTLDFLA
jgi:uncharacterized protein (DUF1501 family)